MRKLIQAMLVVAITLDVAYWTIWFTNRDWIASEQTRAYYEFENAFPLADLWLGAAAAVALWAVTTNHPRWPFWLTCAGSAGLYLFGMDLLYDIENGIFAKGAGGAFEAAIVALTLGFSITALKVSWRAGRDAHPLT